jgi:hypothetical protein
MQIESLSGAVMQWGNRGADGQECLYIRASAMTGYLAFLLRISQSSDVLAVIGQGLRINRMLEHETQRAENIAGEGVNHLQSLGHHQGSEIEERMVVRTQDQNVGGVVRSVVGSSQRADMSGLDVGASLCDQLHPANLTPEVVEVFNTLSNGGVPHDALDRR